MTEDESALFAELKERAHLECLPEMNLTRAARQQAKDLSFRPFERQEGFLDHLRFELYRQGVADYNVVPFISRSDKQGIDSLVALLGGQRERISHCGLGVYGSNNAGRVVWVGVDRVVSLDPFPVRVKAHSRLRLSGVLSRRAERRIKPYLGLPDGVVRELTPLISAADGRFAVDLAFGDTGRYDVELLVDVGHGHETAILAPVFVDIPPDSRPTLSLARDRKADGQPPGDILFNYVNKDRRSNDMKPILRDPRLDAVAQQHSEEMAKRFFFGHISPYSGDLFKRLERRNLAPIRFAENVARSRSLLRIHRNLMSSPSHRLNILDPRFTHLGVGVAKDDEQWIATEIFARW